MIATQNSVMFLEIAKPIARTGSTALDPSASTYLVDGEMAVVDLDGTILNSTTVLTKKAIRIIQSQGALLPSIQSPVIEKSGVKTYSGKAYTAPTVQIDYIGYNAVTNTGDIDVINDNGYEILIQDINSAAYGSIGIGKFGFYVSDSTATKAEINDALAINLFQNTTRLVRKPFIVERVSSSAAGTNTTAGPGGTGTVTFTNGLTTVGISGTSGQDGLVAGAYIKFATAATDTGAVYKIASITATTIELDMPYQGTSGTLTFGLASSMTLAMYVAGSVGIRLTGQAPVFVSPASTEYYVNRWSVGLREFGSTTTTRTQGGTEGSGSYAQIASLEYFTIGNEGFIGRNSIPYITPRQSAVSTATYSLIDLEWDSVKTGQIFNQQANSKQLMLAFADGGSRQQLTGVVTSVQTVLNAWIGTATGLFPDLALA